MIKIHIVPSEIAKQSIPQFSEDLSSTPAQSEIIKTLYKENEDPVERTTEVSDEIYKEIRVITPTSNSNRRISF